MQNQAVRIGQDDDPGRAAGVAIKGLHLAAGGAHQGLVALLRLAQPVPGQDVEAGLAVHVQAVGRAAPP